MCFCWFLWWIPKRPRGKAQQVFHILCLVCANEANWILNFCYRHNRPLMHPAISSRGGVNRGYLIHQLCRDISDTNTRKLLYCSMVPLKLDMKTSVAPTPKFPYSAPLGGNSQPLALNDSHVTLCSKILLLMFKLLLPALHSSKHNHI